MNYERRLLKAGYTTIVASLVVVALLMLPGRAGASDVNFGPITPTPTPGTALPAFDVFGSAGSFLDHWRFTPTSTATFNLNNVNTSFGLFSGLDATLYGPGPTAIATDAPNTMVIGPTSLIAGLQYDLQISGMANAGASYYIGTGFLTSTGGPPPPPIPEPETYAMMLAGLGLMGYVARRRKLKGDA